MGNLYHNYVQLPKGKSQNKSIHISVLFQYYSIDMFPSHWSAANFPNFPWVFRETNQLKGSLWNHSQFASSDSVIACAESDNDPTS